MKRKLLLIILCVLCLSMAGYGIWRITAGNREYRMAEQSYQALSRHVQIPEQPRSEQPAEAIQPARETQSHPEAVPLVQEERLAEDILWPVVDFEALQAINPDIAAWLTLEDTPIHYPVVHGKDNSYYLKRLYDGSWNSAGTIFMDYRNDKTLSHRNTVLYGHNMHDGSMLAGITRFKSQEFYDAHPAALILTPEKNYRLEFFAGYTTHVTDDAWKMFFGSDAEFLEWAAEAAERSDFVSEVRLNPGDRVLTLSTCTYAYDDARYVLVGVLREYSK